MANDINRYAKNILKQYGKNIKAFEENIDKSQSKETSRLFEKIKKETTKEVSYIDEKGRKKFKKVSLDLNNRNPMMSVIIKRWGLKSRGTFNKINSYKGIEDIVKK